MEMISYVAPLVPSSSARDAKYVKELQTCLALQGMPVWAVERLPELHRISQEAMASVKRTRDATLL